MTNIGNCCYNNPAKGVRSCLVYNDCEDSHVDNATQDKFAGDYLNRIEAGLDRRKVAHYDCYQSIVNPSSSGTLKTIGTELAKAVVGKVGTEIVGKLMK